MGKPQLLRLLLSDLGEPEQVLRQQIDPDRVAELADSLNNTGQLQPILVRKEGSKYRIIAGHRRYLAARLLGWTHLTALEAQTKDIPDLILSLTENTARENLTPLEEAITVHDLVVKQGQDLDRVAKMFGRSRGWAETRLLIYDLPKELREAIHHGHLPFTVARELAGITDPGYRAHMVEEAIRCGCSFKTAQLWRQEWEARGAPQMQHEPGDGERPQYIPPPAVGMNCSACNKLTSLTSLTTLHVCPECLRPKGETAQ